MDPNETLRLVRKAIKDLRTAQDLGSNDAEIEAAHELADAFEDLDGWMRQGGGKPVSWS